MKLIIDADACPVLDLALGTAEEKGLSVIIVCDSSHTIERDNATTLTVDKGADSADIKIANILQKGDIVVTQDYGLAALVLGKGGRAINQNGLIFTDNNIENLLYSRYVGKKLRRSGKRTRGPAPRKAEDDTAFIKAMNELLEEI